MFKVPCNPGLLPGPLSASVKPKGLCFLSSPDISIEQMASIEDAASFPISIQEGERKEKVRTDVYHAWQYSYSHFSII